MGEIDTIWHAAEDSAQLIVDAANELIMPQPIIQPDKRWLWLTVPNCGFAVEVLRQTFERQGQESAAVINQGVDTRSFLDHALLAFECYEETVYVDPTYLQLFSEFGLDGNLIVESWDLEQGDVLPAERVIAYTESSLDELVSWLTEQAVFLLGRWQSSSAWQKRYPLPDDQSFSQYYSLSRARLDAFFRRIYDPKYFKPFSQTPDKQQLISEYIDEYEPDQISAEALLRSFIARI